MEVGGARLPKSSGDLIINIGRAQLSASERLLSYSLPRNKAGYIYEI
jgi:hypothetical protein